MKKLCSLMVVLALSVFTMGCDQNAGTTTDTPEAGETEVDGGGGAVEEVEVTEDDLEGAEATPEGEASLEGDAAAPVGEEDSSAAAPE